jgi:cell wall assembly regulator SMI1/predicted DNA-binding WGR domain protein
MFTKRYFICQDEKSSKFWDIEFRGDFVKSFYGKIGSIGKFSGNEKGNFYSDNNPDKKIKQKLKSGYTEVEKSYRTTPRQFVRKTYPNVLEDSVSFHWLVYREWYTARKGSKKRFNIGASQNDFDKLEKVIGYALPSELIELYKINNGSFRPSKEDIAAIERSGFYGFDFFDHEFFFFDFFTIDEIVKNYEIDRILDGDPSWSRSSTSLIPNTIKKQHTNPKWIPLFGSQGDYIGVDLDPDSEGKIGQIINFGSRENNKFVIAENLKAFLEFTGNYIEDGTCDENLRNDAETNMLLYGFPHPDGHLIDNLRNIILK